MIVSVSSAAIRHSSTASAWAEKSAKFVPSPSHVAPSGRGDPGNTCIVARQECENRARADDWDPRGAAGSEIARAPHGGESPRPSEEEWRAGKALPVDQFLR